MPDRNWKYGEMDSDGSLVRFFYLHDPSPFDVQQILEWSRDQNDFESIGSLQITSIGVEDGVKRYQSIFQPACSWRSDWCFFAEERVSLFDDLLFVIAFRTLAAATEFKLKWL